MPSQHPIEEGFGVLDAQVAGDEPWQERVAEGREGAGLGVVMLYPLPKAFKNGSNPSLSIQTWNYDGKSTHFYKRDAINSTAMDRTGSDCVLKYRT